MAFITIEVKGFEELFATNDRVIRELPNTRKTVHQRVGTFLTDELIKNVHVWEKRKSGTHMKDEIRLERADENSALVGVRKDYAQTENARPGTKAGHGPHNFADRSVETTQKEGLVIAKEEYDKLFGI